MTAPPCYRCNNPFNHRSTDTCSGYVWPGSTVAAWIDFKRKVGEVGLAFNRLFWGHLVPRRYR